MEVKCKEVIDQLSDYLDAEARAELCRAIEEHLAHCGDCKVVVDTVRKTIVLYHNSGPDEAPSDALNRILWHDVRGWNTPYPAVKRSVFFPMSVNVADEDRKASKGKR